MRTAVAAAFFLWPILALPQVSIQGTVRESKTREPLPFCNIILLGGRTGGLTNADGRYSIVADPRKDTVVFSYVGYETQKIPAARLARNGNVTMVPKEIVLQEVTVPATDDYLYDLLDRCRKQIFRDHARHSAKVYYGIETESGAKPIELVECYYNGDVDGPFISQLHFRNGRIGLAVSDSRYFITLNSSKAFIGLGLAGRNDNFPDFPLQLSKKEMKKSFAVQQKYADLNTYAITFQPRSPDHQGFSGEIWIDRITLAPMRIDLSTPGTSRHPFLPLFPEKDSLSKVGITISETFTRAGGSLMPDHISFSYRFSYTSVRDSVDARTMYRITRDIATNGIIFFYDFGNPFILPYFDYDENYDDYRKMSIIPYNDLFWKNTNPILLSEKQKEDLGFLSHEGYLLNFDEQGSGKEFLKIIRKFSDSDSTLSSFFEFNYIFWSRNERLILNRKLDRYEPYPYSRTNGVLPAALYNLDAQILLDVTQVGDSLPARSYTVFDVAKTYYHYQQEPNTNAFLNIYFDIWEIERARLQRDLDQHNYPLRAVDSLYHGAVEHAGRIAKLYLKEAELGKNTPKMKEWNDYVMKNLGIDNLKMFTGTIPPH